MRSQTRLTSHQSLAHTRKRRVVWLLMLLFVLGQNRCIAEDSQPSQTALVGECLPGFEGDVNNDGHLSPLDVLQVLQHFLGLRSFNECQLARANVLNPTGSAVTLADGWRIFQRFLDETGTPRAPKPNFVVLLTDDQRWDTLWAMPIVQDKLVARGVTFTNAFITTPVCCPARASILAGGFYAHNTGVLTNGRPNGSVEKFNDTETLATLLQNAGYKTALVGKYLNGYNLIAPYIPPGWTMFTGLKRWQPGQNRNWFNFDVAMGSSGVSATQGKNVVIGQYITDFLTEQALAFLDQHGNTPFFLYLSTNAPHAPATPAPGDEALFSDFLYRDRAYGEEDRSDKPAWVTNTSPYNTEAEDDFHRNQLRSLQAVDRAVGAIVERIEAMGKFDETVFIFTSDNGLMWGEHGLRGKGKPYEESIRVPLVVVMPGVAPRMDAHSVAVNLDIGPTLFDLAGVEKRTDGLSLLPILQDPDAGWREDFLIENYALGSNETFVWAGLRITREGEEWKYIEYATGEKELYDLVADPFEESSRHADTAYRDTITELAGRLEAIRGLAVTTFEAPMGVVGQAYTFQIRHWGGREPLTWEVIQGQLPVGLALKPSSGIISGVPTQPEEQYVLIRVTDSSTTTQTGAPQAWIEDFTFTINAPRIAWQKSVTR